jgi:DNA-nicking Smr family endonuclease
MNSRIPPEMDEDDKAVWRELARSVKPLSRRLVQPVLPASRKTARKPAPMPDAPIRAIPHPPYIPPVSPPGGLARRPGAIDDKTTRAIARGSMEIGGRLDLHGMTEAQAHVALVRFVENGARNGVKVLLVITGKGERSGGALRAAVPRWLAERPLADLVAGFRQAGPRHGAEGACYVRLRTQPGRKP